jgi:hypothetical protein
MDEPTCSVCGESGRLTRDRCDKHYRALLKELKARGEPLPKGPKLIYPCDVSGCEDLAGYKRLCEKHREKKNRTGDPLTPDRRRIKRDPEERFLEKVDKSGPIPLHRPDLGPCWTWTAAKTKLGYGKFHYDGRLGKAHGFAYEHFIGPIPDGCEDLDHLCRNPSCVNPAHLEPVTHRENVLRGAAPSAVNAAKTHCDRNHEFTEANTYIRIGQGGKKMRICRACHREDVNRANQEKRASRQERSLF